MGRFFVVSMLLVLGGNQIAAATSGPTRPRLFSSVKLIESRWRHDTSVYVNHKNYCAHGGARPDPSDDLCDYRAGAIYVAVTYGGGTAQEFRLPAFDPADQWGNKSPAAGRYWQFMTSLLPAGARKYACATVKPSDQGGPAHACLYRYHFGGASKWSGNTLIVAQYLDPSEGNDAGVVEPDISHMGFQAVHL